MATIQKRGSSYTITVSMGFDGTGKRIRKSMKFTPPPSMTLKQAEKEAHRQAALFEERCRTGQVLDTNTRFSEFAEIWLRDYAEKQLAERTLRRYKELLTRINAAFGNMKINEIQPHHLNAFYNRLGEKGIRADIKYKPTEKAAELLAALEGEPYKYQVMVQLLLHTGLRRGELLGLEWRDIDFLNKRMYIKRNSLYTPEKGVFVGDTKTESSDRDIALNATAVQLLKDYKRYQDNIIQEMGTAWQGTGQLFTTKDGKPMHPDTLTRWINRFVKRKGLSEITAHSLRHTHATLLIASGTDIKTVSSRLGHASVTTTGNIYTHAIKSADEAAAENLEIILSTAKNSNRTKIG